MKNLVQIILVFLLTTVFAFSQNQTCDCKTDLDFVVAKMKKMPSYKKQIKGEKAVQFENNYQLLSEKMTQPILVEDCYKLLLKQMLLVNDNHTSLRYNNATLNKSILNDATKLEVFIKSDDFKIHPKADLDLQVLQTRLQNTTTESLEGIYTYRGEETIGVYLDENKKDLIGVVLNTNLKHWKAGEIRFIASPTSNNKFNVYYYNVDTRAPGMIKSLTFENGRLWRYKKVGNTYENEFLSEKIDLVAFKQLNKTTQYLYFKNFSNNKRKELNAFFENTKDKITAKNIIVDLRTNSGGNKKFSDPFLKYLKNKNVYVITNHFTGSNGEQFTSKLLKNKNAKHLGQATFGIIAYGINHGNSYNTPSGYFSMMPTDMNFHEFYEYEGKGITPSIKLDFSKDWIAQTLEVIAADNK